SGPRVEGARALPRAAPADEVPLSREDDLRDELRGLPGHLLLVLEALLARHFAPRLGDELADFDSPARPLLCPRARLVALVDVLILLFYIAVDLFLLLAILGCVDGLLILLLFDRFGLHRLSLVVARCVLHLVEEIR